MTPQSQFEVQTEVERNICDLEHVLQRSDVDPRPVVVMMCGVAGSGKSTYAKAIARLYPEFRRLSFDGILAERYGFYGIDYPKSEHETYANEADQIFEKSAEKILAHGQQNLILDRAFYAKEDRDLYRSMIERNGAKSVLLYFDVPKDVLWSRICARREGGVTADCALDISEELLDFYAHGFEIPEGEGEIVLHSAHETGAS